jgi:hypothetical protein
VPLSEVNGAAGPALFESFPHVANGVFGDIDSEEVIGVSGEGVHINAHSIND